MIPLQFCKGGILLQCKYCNKIYRLGERVKLSLALELKARANGCTFIEDDCGCSKDTATLIAVWR